MNSYILTDDIIVRKEYFGCICFDYINSKFYQYNSDGFEILELLKSKHTIPELTSSLNKKGFEIEPNVLYSILENFVENRIIEVNKNVINSAAKIFYSSKDTFQNNCLVAPTACTIYLTDYCSKKCLHCIVRSSPYIDRTGELNIHEWKLTLKKLRDWGIFSIIVTGGEPFLYKDLFELLNYASDLDIHISLLTDFDGMTTEHIKELKKIRTLQYIQTSLDGGCEETHDFIRGKGSFKKTMKRLNLFKENEIGFTISTAVHKGNIHELNEIHRIYKEMKGKYLYLNPLAPYGRAKDELKNLVLDKDELKKLGYYYYYLIAVEGVKTGNAFWHNLKKDDVLKSDFNPFGDALDAMTVAAYQFSINSKGDCYLDSKMKSENLLKLGNVTTNDFEEMWSKPILSKLRETYNPEKAPFISHQSLINIISNN